MAYSLLDQRHQEQIQFPIFTESFDLDNLRFRSENDLVSEHYHFCD